MANIALFHSVLGVRPGVLDAATRFEDAGHTVYVIDQYEGESFDDYDEATEFAEEIGYPELMARAADAVIGLPNDLIVAGFSNGGGMAEFVATQRPTSGVIMFSGALPLSMLSGDSWPTGVPSQIHYGTGDPFRIDEGIDELLKDIADAGAENEFFDYDVSGHLFTDTSMENEYDAAATGLLFSRALEFCDRVS